MSIITIVSVAAALLTAPPPVTGHSQTSAPQAEPPLCALDSASRQAAAHALGSQFMTFDVQYRAVMWMMRDSAVNPQTIQHRASRLSTLTESLWAILPNDDTYDSRWTATIDSIRNYRTGPHEIILLKQSDATTALRWAVIHRVLQHPPNTPASRARLATFLDTFQRFNQVTDSLRTRDDETLHQEQRQLADSLMQLYRQDIYPAWYAALQSSEAMPLLLQDIEARCRVASRFGVAPQ